MSKITKEALIGDAKTLSPEAKENRKSINKKIFKFGCLPIIGIIVLVIVIGIFSDNNKEASNQIQTTKPQINTNNPITGKSDLGVLKMDKNGNSIGQKTELTELRRFLNIDSIDVIEITFELKATSTSFKKKIIYDKRTFILKDIYTTTNVIEEYKNVSVDLLKSFIDKGEKHFIVLADNKNVKYDFNNRETTNDALGEKPEQSELDASVKIVKEYVKSIANDESSIKFLEWSKVTPSGEYWIVRAKYKGSNAYGALVTENMWFYIQNNKVVKTKSIQP
jgi:hypothetical protein